MTSKQEPALAMKLHHEDSVAVVLVPVRRGEDVRITGQREPTTIAAAQDVPCYHKIAVASVQAGQTLVRSATAIGRATKPIAVGDWVHTHNLVSLCTRHDTDDPIR